MLAIPSGGSPDKVQMGEEKLSFACLPSLLLASSSILFLPLLFHPQILKPDGAAPHWVLVHQPAEEAWQGTRTSGLEETTWASNVNRRPAAPQNPPGLQC